ncbi:MAG: iron-sulfur cluster assembly protein, partial [Bacteroidota bacterium]
MEMDKTSIVKALATVKDPHTGQDLITANMVLNLEIEGNNVSFTLELPNLNNDYKSNLNFACQGAIMEVYPQANVHVHMVGRSADAQVKASPLPHVKNIIAVASGKGGVGKSTISTNLA